MPTNHPPRACFSAVGYDPGSLVIRYTFSADSKDHVIPSADAVYIYDVQFPNLLLYLDAAAAGSDGFNYNDNIRGAYPFTRV